MQAAQAIWLDEFTAAYRDLLRFLRRRTGSDDTARDLAQDTWLRMAEHQSTPAATDAVGPLAPITSDHARAYLFTVADRLAIDHLRRQRHWHDELAPRLQAGPTHAPDVAESHAYAQALRAVDAALARMPARMREVFVDHRLGGVPHEELAQRFGVSRKTIERDITSAMDLAQAALEQDEPALSPSSMSAARTRSAVTAPARQGRRKALAALLGGVGLSSSAAVAWHCWREWVPEWQTAFATSAGRVGRLPLPDGSEVMLDADSEIEVRLLATRREVRLLRGGAFFAVARDATRPFIVRAGPARVVVLGTRFAVETGAQGVLIGVESGRVAVQGPRGAALQLGAGEAARVPTAGGAEPAPMRDPDAIAPWRTGWLEFDHIPLAQAVERLNRYRPDTRVRVDAAVADWPVLARVHIAGSNQWLYSLPRVLPVRVVATADGGVLIQPR